MMVRGMAPLTFVIGNRSFSHNVFIINNLSHDVILGKDFLELHKSKIDLENHTLHLQDNFPFSNYPAPGIDHLRQDPLVCTVHALQSYILPPNTETMICGKLNSACPQGSVGIVDPRSELATRYNICGDAELVTASPSRIDDTLDALHGAQIFSTLDLRSGYWQIGLQASAREKTAFIIHRGLYEFTVLPFGICNSPSTFQRLMEHVLRGLNWKTCLIYIDDIIVYTRNVKEHLTHLEDVFLRLHQANVKLKPSKCFFARDHVEYLGHIVSKDGIRPNPDKSGLSLNSLSLRIQRGSAVSWD